ncbi:hypothetical protein CDAR_382301 [Caerostris darwini]|uniref:Uncharacterized protein n=1 Tax=Caerostris darwini TaxID=1538125 RepID=A0AAV4W0H0_9ARAC|nr:hypothetical protein CDAR_382301 [Caerostris darwini]
MGYQLQSIQGDKSPTTPQRTLSDTEALQMTLPSAKERNSHQSNIEPKEKRKSRYETRNTPRGEGQENENCRELVF